MKLKDLQKKIPDTSDNLISVPIEWRGEKFNCFVKVEPSYGSQERIHRAFADADVSVNARIISEFCSIGEAGEEKLRYEIVDDWPSDLVVAMRKAYDSVHEAADEDETKSGAEGEKAKKP